MSWVFHPGLWQTCGAVLSSAWLEMQAEIDEGLRCSSGSEPSPASSSVCGVRCAISGGDI